MSLLVVGVMCDSKLVANTVDRGPVLSTRIVNVLVHEISLETGFHGSSSYPVPRRVAACRIHAPRTQRCGQSGHGCQTLAADTRHGHQTRRTLDRRTLTEGADRATKAWRASEHPGTTTPLGRRTVLLWAAAAYAALGNHDGLAVRPRASARLPAALQLLGRSAGVQAAPRRTAPLGRLRVERRANGDASSVMAGGLRAYQASDAVHLWRTWGVVSRCMGVVACGGMWRLLGGGSVGS